MRSESQDNNAAPAQHSDAHQELPAVNQMKTENMKEHSNTKAQGRLIREVFLRWKQNSV